MPSGLEEDAPVLQRGGPPAKNQRGCRSRVRGKHVDGRLSVCPPADNRRLFTAGEQTLELPKALT